VGFGTLRTDPEAEDEVGVSGIFSPVRTLVLLGGTMVTFSGSESRGGGGDEGGDESI